MIHDFVIDHIPLSLNYSSLPVQCSLSPNCISLGRMPCGTNITRIAINTLSESLNIMGHLMNQLLDALKQDEIQLTPPNTCGPCRLGLVDENSHSFNNTNELDIVMMNLRPGNGTCVDKADWNQRAGVCLLIENNL